jgi:Alpha-kinase family/von Willebrand factor type A domain
MTTLSRIDEVYSCCEDDDDKSASDHFQFEHVQRITDEPWLVSGAVTVEREQRLSLALKTTQARGQELAQDAEARIAELSDLLSKLKTSTATKAEVEKAAFLDEQLKDVLRDVRDNKTRTTELEIEKAKTVTSRKTAELHRAIKARDIQDVLRSVRAAESVDLAFVIDATGSMTPYIENVKKSVEGIVKQVKSTNSYLQLRLAVVAYRDLCLGDRRFETLDFVQDDRAFMEFLGRLTPIGNSDTAEDMAGGIQQANGLTWTNPTRVVFVIGDAPCHGVEFHPLAIDDRYPGGTPGVNIKEELRKLQSLSRENGSMTLYFGRLTDQTELMLTRFHEEGISIEVVDFNNASRVVTAVTKGVRNSIFKTMTLNATGIKSVAFSPADLKTGASRSSQKTRKHYSVIPEATHVNELTAQPLIKVKVCRSRPVKSMDDLKAPFEFGMISFRRGAKTDITDKSTMVLRCGKEPFAEGETRISFRGQLSPAEAEMSHPKSAVVLKSFKFLGDGVNDLKQYLKQMEVSNIAYYLSKQYNKSFRRTHCGRVHFLQVCVVEALDETKEANGNRRFCAENPLPTNEFTHFSNNTGYWNHDFLDETLLRFTEFTYQATNGYLMVTDLQGVRKGKDFYLTDPVVLCKDVLRFGCTNLGETFMQKCIDATWALMKEKGW